jgi:hypothetical protein
MTKNSADNGTNHKNMTTGAKTQQPTAKRHTRARWPLPTTWTKQKRTKTNKNRRQEHLHAIVGFVATTAFDL